MTATRTPYGLAGANPAEYRAWTNMLARCYYKKDRAYQHYGGRGILVCPDWRADFEAFLHDLGPRPIPEHSLDRIDNDGHYLPSNVRWATREQQQGNRRGCLPDGMGARPRLSMKLPESVMTRLRAFAAKMAMERGGKWTDPVTVQYLLDLADEKNGTRKSRPRHPRHPRQ